MLHYAHRVFTCLVYTHTTEKTKFFLQSIKWLVLQLRRQVFTARYGLMLYIKEIRSVFQTVKYSELDVVLKWWEMAAGSLTRCGHHHSRRTVRGGTVTVKDRKIIILHLRQNLTIVNWDLRSSRFLRSVQLFTDVSGQPIGPVFKGPAFQVFECLTLEASADVPKRQLSPTNAV
jgi:hypothetical protein